MEVPTDEEVLYLVKEESLANRKFESGYDVKDQLDEESLQNLQSPADEDPFENTISISDLKMKRQSMALEIRFKKTFE